MNLRTATLGQPAALGPPPGAAEFLGREKKTLTGVGTSGIKGLPIDEPKEPRPCLFLSLATPLKILSQFFAGGRGNSSSIGPAKTAQDNLDPENPGKTRRGFWTFLCPIIYKNSYKSTLLTSLRCCNIVARRPEITAFGRFFAQIRGGALWNAYNARNKASNRTADGLADVQNMLGDRVEYAGGPLSRDPQNAQDVKIESPYHAGPTSQKTPKPSPTTRAIYPSSHIGRNCSTRESTYSMRLWTAWVRGPKEFWKHSPEKRKKSNTTKRRLEGGKMEASTEIDVVCPWCGGWVQVISDPNGGPLVRAAHLLKSPKEGKKVQLCFGSSTRVEGY